MTVAAPSSSSVSRPGETRSGSRGGFVQARRRTRYARTVRLLRVLLPALAAVLVGIVMLWPQLAGRQDQFRIGFADLEIANDGLSMVAPRYVGTDDQNRPYSIAASSVRHLVPDSRDLMLDMPEAEITLDDGNWVSVSAETGTYHVTDEILYLSGSVRLFHDQGYQLQTSSAIVDLARSEVSGSELVAGHGPAGYLEGTGFRVHDGGTFIHVLGPAQMIINPSAGALH